MKISTIFGRADPLNDQGRSIAKREGRPRRGEGIPKTTKKGRRKPKRERKKRDPLRKDRPQIEEVGKLYPRKGEAFFLSCAKQ